MRHLIYTAFGLTVTKKTGVIELIQRLLKKVGMDLKYSRVVNLADGQK